MPSEIVDLIWHKYKMDSSTVIERAVERRSRDIETDLRERRNGGLKNWTEARFDAFSKMYYEFERLCNRHVTSGLPARAKERLHSYIDRFERVRLAENPKEPMTTMILKYRSKAHLLCSNFDEALTCIDEAYERVDEMKSLPEAVHERSRMGLLNDKALVYATMGSESAAIAAADDALDIALRFTKSEKDWISATYQYFIQGRHSQDPHTSCYFTHCDIRSQMLSSSDTTQKPQEISYYWERLTSELDAPQSLPIHFLVAVVSDSKWASVRETQLIQESCARTLYVKASGGTGEAVARYIIASIADIRVGSKTQAAAVFFIIALCLANLGVSRQASDAISSNQASQIERSLLTGCTFSISELPERIELDDICVLRSDFLKVADTLKWRFDDKIVIPPVRPHDTPATEVDDGGGGDVENIEGDMGDVRVSVTASDDAVIQA